MNKLPPNRVTFKSAQRRWIRTIATLAILGALFGFAWKPRLVSENFLRDATDVTVGDNSYTSVGPPNARELALEAELPQTTAPRHLWYVGGFPLDAYQTQWSHNEGHDGMETWGTLGLGLWIDLWFCLGVLALAGSAAYHIRPGQSIGSVLWSPKPAGNGLYRRVLLSTLSVGVVATAWCFYSTQRDLRMLGKQSRVTLARSTNHPMIARLPLTFRGPWTHAIRVQCLPESDVQAIDWDKHPSIQFIAIHGEIDAQTLHAIDKNPFITGLRWSNVPSLESANAVCDQLPALRSLSLSFDNADTATQFASGTKLQLQTLDHLSSLTVRRIPCKSICTDELLVPSLTSLDIQTIGPSTEPWLFEESPNLQSLSLSHRHQNPENDPREAQVTVRLMPALTKLSLDSSIPVELHLLVLPRLIDLQGIGSMAANAARTEDDDGYIVRVSSLKMSGLSSLSKLDVVGENIDQWEAEECPRLRTVRIKQPSTEANRHFRRRMRPGSMVSRLVDTRMFPPMRPGPAHSQPRPSKGLVALATALPSLQSLNVVDMDLTTCDFSDLKTCKYLKSLELDHCLIEPSQLGQLQGVNTLRELSVSGAHIDPDTVPPLLAMHNDWEVLELPWQRFDTVRIVDQPKLRRAFTTQTLRAKHVELVNLNSLISRLNIAPGAETIRVKNLPSLTEISIRRPKTRNIVIEDVPQLLSFTLEQGVLKSSTLQHLKQCRQLHSLILPGSHYPQGLAQHFPSWPGLQELNAIATPLRDDDLQHLPSLKNLRRLRLDRTALTEKGISTLARCDQLQSVSLVGLNLPSTALEPLAALSSLMELSVNDAIPLPDALQPIRITPDDWAARNSGQQLVRNWPNEFRTNAGRGKNLFRPGQPRGRRSNWAPNGERNSNQPMGSRQATLTTDAT
ncbi:MAG: adenylate cyclase [Rhodopirellula sp. JB055]|uniref:adenylate cyclase n=1 Tax=Rhodopirellula sp. JB055 TaxID=3342846 RepID=UPI003709DBC5